MSNKGLETKNEEKEENHDADDRNEDDEDDLDDNELDDMALMSDWERERDWLNIQGNWLCWNVLQIFDCPEGGAPILLAWHRIAMVLSDFTPACEGFYIHRLLHKQICIKWYLNIQFFIQWGIEKKFPSEMLWLLKALCVTFNVICWHGMELKKKHLSVFI